MEIVDTHCHLYSEEFDGDRDEMIGRARERGVRTFYLPAIDSSSIPGMLKLEADYPGVCKAMMGLHPCYVKENWREELAIVEDWLSKREFAAVGEIGLDFYWDRTFEEQQYEAFRTQIAWAKKYNLPIVIHSRNSMQECINMVREAQDGTLKGIFHCFGGSLESARQIINAGMLLGIGGVLTYKNAGLPAILEQIPLEHIVLETDAPYLTPVPLRGKRNESSYLTYIISKLAEVKGVSEEEVARITTANSDRLFKL